MKIVPSGYFLDDFFDDFVGHDSRPTPHHNPMKCDVYELNNIYNIEVDLPGFDKENIKIETKDGYITITAEKKEVKDENKKYYHHERRYGRVERTFYLGDIDAEKVKAKMENGILKIEIPKIVEKESKRIINID